MGRTAGTGRIRTRLQKAVADNRNRSPGLLIYAKLMPVSVHKCPIFVHLGLRSILVLFEKAHNGRRWGAGERLLIIQSDEFNQSKINTIIAAVITSNIRLAAAPGNIKLSAKRSKLPKDSVINVSQIITIDRLFLTEKVHSLPSKIMALVDDGLKLVLRL